MTTLEGTRIWSSKSSKSSKKVLKLLTKVGFLDKSSYLIDGSYVLLSPILLLFFASFFKISNLFLNFSDMST